MTTSFKTIKELRKFIQSEINFSGKKITSINGIDLDRNLAELKVSQKHVTVETYTPAIGHKMQFVESPFTIQFN